MKNPAEVARGYLTLGKIKTEQTAVRLLLLGMLAATALEYVTGAAMEALFKVRYWDYSKQPFNLNGYICLTSSLAWGFLPPKMRKKGSMASSTWGETAVVAALSA